MNPRPTPRTPRRRQLEFSERRVLLALGDILAVLAATLIALFIWTRVAGYAFTVTFIAEQIYWFVVLVLLWLFLASANDFFDLRIAARRDSTIRRLLIITGQTWVVYVIVFFVSPVGALPRLFIVYYGVASFILIGAWRLMRPFLLGWVSQPRRLLILGADWSAETIINAIRENAADEYEIRGMIGRSEEVGKLVSGVPVLGTGDDMMNFVNRDRISEIVITAAAKLPGETFQGVMDAYEQGISVVPMALFYERLTGRVPVEHVNDDWAVVFLPVRNSDAAFDPYPLLKRLMDIGFAVVGLVVFGLLFPFIALIVYLDSPGSIFYSQERIGKNGCVFRIYKLRSMIPNAEAATGAVFAQDHDPRVTRVGRVLRKTRLDEVPQLFNVLRGDMSMVGPRPERPEHVGRLTDNIPFYRTRLIVRPGLTGWAQVRYGYGATDDDALVKLQYDLYYIRHQSLILDINILLRTVGRVLTFSGT